MVQGRVAIPGQAASGLLAAAIIGAIAETHDGRTLRAGRRGAPDGALEAGRRHRPGGPLRETT